MPTIIVINGIFSLFYFPSVSWPLRVDSRFYVSLSKIHCTSLQLLSRWCNWSGKKDHRAIRWYAYRRRRKRCENNKPMERDRERAKDEQKEWLWLFPWNNLLTTGKKTTRFFFHLMKYNNIFKHKIIFCVGFFSAIPLAYIALSFISIGSIADCLFLSFSVKLLNMTEAQK